MTNLTLTGWVRYVSEAFDDDQNIRRLPPGAELNLKGAWALGPDREVYLALDNVADARLSTGKTADFVTSLGAPFTARVGFSYRR